VNVPIFTVDAFTSEPFRGNPASVCLLDALRSDAWMQGVAAEMNHAETAFLDQGRLRWFTPKVEVDLCGHATLATAHVLWESGRLAARDTAKFETRSGTLTAARKNGGGGDGEIELDFPSVPAQRADAPPGLIESLGVKPRFVGRNRFDWFVEVASEAEVRAASPDFARLKAIPARGVILTSLADPANAKSFDFVSRFFAPAAGIDEDPVTGSAHCCLAPYWCERLRRDELLGFQASERGGFVRVKQAGERVLLGGRAVTVLRGELAAES